MGLNIGSKKIIIENFNILIQIWNIKGGPNFKFLIPTYIRGSSAGIYLYEMPSKIGIDKHIDWVETFLKNMLNSSKKIPLTMIGFKREREENYIIQKENFLKSFQKYDIFQYYELEQINEQMVSKIFFTVIKQILRINGFI